MNKHWKNKTDLFQTVSIVIIAVVIAVILVSNRYFFGGFWNASTEIQNLTAQLDSANKDNTALKFDILRVKDTANISLAIQDYYFENGVFPSSLEELKAAEYLDTDSRLSDPSTGQAYYYLNRDNDFVLCIWLSDSVGGFNFADCENSPSEEVTPEPKPNQTPVSTPAPSSTIVPFPGGETSTSSKSGELEVIGNVTSVNVRAEPNTSSTIITKVYPGDKLAFQATENNWYRVIISKANGEKRPGWIFGEYVEVIK